MPHTRILIFGLRRMMRAIIENAVLGEPDLEVVHSDHSSLLAAIEESGADVVITDSDNPQLVIALLERHPRLKLVALAAGGRDARLYELRLWREELEELSLPALLEVLRK